MTDILCRINTPESILDNSQLTVMETLKYLVFLYCVTALDSTETCDGIGRDCKTCIVECPPRMCTDESESERLLFKKHCCFTVSKDKMVPNCKSLCFSEEEAQLEKIKMMSLEIEDKDKKLEAKNNEIKELKETLKATESSKTCSRISIVGNKFVSTSENEPMTTKTTAGGKGGDKKGRNTRSNVLP